MITEETNGVTLITMSDQEWDEMVQKDLDELGLTYEELADMARRRDFCSIEALKMWMAIGD